MANGTAVTQRREQTPAQRIKQILESRKDEFGAALAKRVDPDAFIRVAYATITKSPKLLEATPASVMMALLEAASLGLTPNGVMGEAYIVPFNNKVKTPQGDRWEVQAQFIPGYRGLIKLARQSGVVKTIVARAVYPGDHFEVEYGLDDRLVHVPDMDAAEDGRLTHVYAIAHFADGTRQFEVMSRKAVDKIRARSKSKDSGPWVTDFEPMAIKTVIRRLFKYLPSSDFDLTRAVEADNREYEPLALPVAEAASGVLAAPSRAAQLRDRIAVPALPAAEVEEEFEDAEILPEAVPAPAPAAVQAPQPEPAGYSADELLETVANLSPRGGDATKAQRDRLKQHADSLFGAGTEEALSLHAAADSAKLGKGQVGRLIAMAKAALQEAGKPDPDQEQETVGVAAGEFEGEDLFGGDA